MKTTFIMICMVLVTLASCKKLSDIFVIKKNIDYKEAADLPIIPRTGVPFPAGGVNLSFPVVGIPTNSKDFINENNTSASLLTSVKANKLALAHISPEGGSFTYIDSLKLFVSAPGIPEKLAAFNYNIVKGTKLIDMHTVDLELKEHFIKDSIFFRLEGHFYDYPDSNSTVEMQATFGIVANPLNK